MNADWIGWGIGIVGIVVGIVSFGYAVYIEMRTRNRMNIAHSTLVALKTGIQGENRDEVISAINNLLETLKPPTKPPTP